MNRDATNEPDQLNTIHRILIVLPVLVMLIVAGAQIVRAKSGVLAPDKGGGFGMFATVDQLGSRMIRLVLINADGRERAVPPRPEYQLDDYVYATYSNPTDERLRHIGQRVGAVYTERGLDVGSVRVEIWRLHFYSESRVIERQLYKQLTIPIADEVASESTGLIDFDATQGADQ